MKTLITLLFLLKSFQALPCTLTADKGNINLEWIAFKTPKKAPVKARFKDLGIAEKIQGKDLETFLTGIEFNIDTTSTSTRNTARDANIVRHFFQKFVGKMEIKGKTLKLEQNKLKVAITINQVTKIVNLDVTKKDKKVQAKGTIDVLDFKLSSALASINKACYDLHEGKTWNDVDVILTIYLDNACN